ncbi:cysteine-rich receptor-like protein kinase 25-like protein [Trifolium pratense]|uniref:Cysteine-rich receptor-like protein kinase 25-like protein n=1 Tax=Trifolium pratense TaxID=57577 RepID=A0A2K3KB88_TRIPR|nr:cysteine-rich receptor-like protein kinase 25-like protein [Trifolium pratense]
MISARGVPKRFWPEAVKWTTYVMNRSPTLGVKDVTPEEAWSGKKPSMHRFKTFGCIGHVHIHDSQRRKLDKKSKRCVLLGVCEESKAYKLYDPTEKRIIISKDVVFEESKGCNWEKSKKQVTTSDDWEEVESESETAQHDIEDQATTDAHEIANEDENVVINDTSSDSEYERNSPLGARIIKLSVRLNDYVTESVAQEDTDEELHNLAVINTPVKIISLIVK